MGGRGKPHKGSSAPCERRGGNKCRGGARIADRRTWSFDRNFKSAALTIANQLVDTALQFAFLFFAPAQPRREVGAGQFVTLGAEGDAHEVVSPPDDPGEKGAALLRNREPYRRLGRAELIAEFEMGAIFRNIAHDALP